MKSILRRVSFPSALLQEVKLLGRRNAKTLGFLPEGAFDEYAVSGELIAALNKDELQGYVAYRFRRGATQIVHLCVDEKYRNHGIARILVEELVGASPQSAGLQANCREDYPANIVWPKLGFTVRDEIPGRATRKPTTLKVWWRDLGHPDLFSFAPKNTPTASIDINILIDLQSSDAPQYDESKSLLADWFADAIEITITDEIYAEIERNQDDGTRRSRRQFASTFRTLHVPDPSRLSEVGASLNQLLGKPYTARERSDRNHIAKSILGGADFFITRDTELLDQAGAIEAVWGVTILRPCDIILRTDMELSESGYAPSQLDGTELSIRPMVADDVENVVRKFQRFSKKESKGALLSSLRQYLAAPMEAKVRVVVRGSDEMVAVLVTKTAGRCMEVPILRVQTGNMDEVLLRHLVWLVARESVSAKCMCAKISDSYFPAKDPAFLSELGFLGNPPNATKTHLYGSIPESELRGVIASLPTSIRAHSNLAAIENILSAGSNHVASKIILEIEKIFWPARVADSSLPMNRPGFSGDRFS